MNALYLLLQGFRNQSMLLHGWQSFECLACNRYGIERTTSSYKRNEHVGFPYLARSQRESGVRTRDILNAQF